LLFGKIIGGKPEVAQTPVVGKPLTGSGNKYLLERIVKWVLFLLATVSVLTTVGIISVLLYEGVIFFTSDFYENNPVERTALSESKGLTGTALDILAPGIIPAVRVRATTESMIIVDWDIPTAGAPPDSYRIQVAPSLAADLSDCRNLAPERTSCVIANAAPGRSHRVSISAISGVREGVVLQTHQFSVPEAVEWHRFFTDTKWRPLLVPRSYGILTLVTGTMAISIMAMLVAVPLGLISAIFLSEYAHPRLRAITKPILEVLAGIPTIVYGFFALTFITPLLRGILGDAVGTYNALAAAIVMGVMIIPMVSSLSEDAMRAVPVSLREGAYALGATKVEVATKVVVPAALSGIVAAFILAMSRAVGETMIVFIAAGHDPSFSFLSPNPLEAMSTMTGYMVATNFSDNAIPGTAQFQALFAVGITLFIIAMLMNLLSKAVVAKFREVYE
jgi:phosphate transport system permease protein